MKSKSISRSSWWSKLLVAIAVFHTVSSTIAGQAHADDGFTEDAAAAVEQAKQENKDLFLLFTGSDWCPPCKMLENEVLSKDVFLKRAQEDFVLVKLDFPKTNPQDPEIEKQNAQWAEKFGVGSFPTVIMVDPDLKPFAFSGYEAGGAENYLTILENAHQVRVTRDEKIAAAQQASGAQRAKLLDEALSELGEEIVHVYYTDLVEEIVELDSDNELGLRKKWNAARDAEMRKVIMTDLVMMSRLGKPENAMKLIDEVLAEIDFTNNERLTILQLKLNLAKEVEDPSRIDAVLDQMISLDGVQGDTRERLIAKKVYLMVGSGRRDEAMKLLDKTLVGNQDSAHLLFAKGQMLAAENKHEAAVDAFNMGLKSTIQDPDLRIDLVAARADSMYASGDAEGALKTLDDFADNQQMPAELRAEALLQKAMVMYDMNRVRQARLAENRAIEITESPDERASIQKMVERLRQKFGS